MSTKRDYGKLRTGGGGATLLGVFLLCTCVGIIAGNYIKHQVGIANASSTNITVTNNNQISTIDQGTPTMVRSSTVTVKDSTATLGYTLSALISQNTIPNSTISIYSTSSTTCTQSSPCTITNNPTPTTILETNNNNAIVPQGDTTQWTITITMPTNTPQGNYLLDIAYSEDPIIPPTLSDITNMQDATQAICANTTPGTTVSLKDTRDNKYYRVRKMADSRCWMIDNLAFSLLQNDTGTTPNTGAPTYSPAAQIHLGAPAPNFVPTSSTQAQYTKNTSTYNIPNNGNPTSPYLYNWCAAMADTSTNCSITVNYMNQPAIPQTGICPAPFRLPMLGTALAPSTPGNGTNQATAAATTTNEFAKLDIWLGGTGINRQQSTIIIAQNNFKGTANVANNWSGVFSGYNNGLLTEGNVGYWWSSTDFTSYGAYDFAFSDIYAGEYNLLTSHQTHKDILNAVRCLL